MFRAIARLLFDFRVSGLENLPRRADGRVADGRVAGGWICCGIPHRTWVEPLALVAFMPPAPRLVMLADGRVMFRSWWRELLVRWVGGVVPTWRGAGAAGFAAHVAAARRVIDAGSVFALFPEIGPPARPPQPRRMSSSVAYFALRTAAPIVPVVFGGTHELFLRRRIEIRVLPAIHPPTPLPAPGSAAEAAAVASLMDRLRGASDESAAAAHDAAEAAPVRHRRWRWLTGPYPRAD